MAQDSKVNLEIGRFLLPNAVSFALQVMQPIATIRIKCPDEPERSVPLADNTSARIGRDTGNDIVINDPAVSRVHATISVSTAGVVIADNKSTNGTFVNGKKVSMRHIQLGDVIDIGTTKLTVDIQTERALRSLSSNSRSRAMTAQLKPVSVTILLGTLLVSKGDGSCEAPTEETTRLWINQVSDAVFEFSGVIDKECANHIVAMWIGREAGIIAHHAVKAARKIKELTKALTKELRGPKLMAKQILTSGGGLTGVYVGSQLPDGEKFTILGDQLTNIFQLEEGVEVLKQDIIICPSTAELVKKFFNLEESAIKDPQSSVNAQIKMYVVP